MELFYSILGGVVLLAATYFLGLRLYISLAFTYWKKRGIHYVEPTSVFGNIKGVIVGKEHISQCLQKLYNENAGHPYVGLFFGTRPALMVRDLNLLSCIFVKDAQMFLDRNQPHPRTDDLFTRSLFALTGKQWRGLRIKLTPTFTSGRIKRMFHLINECGEQLVSCLEHEVLQGGSVGVKDVTARYSTDVIASCAFGVNANALTDPACEFRVYLRKIFEPKLWKKLARTVLMVMPIIGRKLRLSIVDPSIYDFVRRTFWDVVDYRKKNKLVRDDFVDLLLQIKQNGRVQGGDMNELKEIEQDSQYMNGVSKTEKNDINLEDNDILAQAFIFILAGFETSSSVITYALYELALHPDIQERLRKEIQAVLRKHNNEVTYDAIAAMTYLDMVVSETLRKYPTLPMLERLCLSDYKVQATGELIEKGTKVIIPVLAVHYDPDIYPDPQKFDPERFSAENKRERSNFAYIPFGEGPRICIGMRFGQMQVKTALAHVITSFQVRPCADTPQSPLLINPENGVLTPKSDVVLAFAKLNNSLEE